MDYVPKDMWEGKLKENLDQQPYMKDLIINALFQKPHQSWRSIEGEMNSWCSHMTIERFVKSFDLF